MYATPQKKRTLKGPQRSTLKAIQDEAETKRKIALAIGLISSFVFAFELKGTRQGFVSLAMFGVTIFFVRWGFSGGGIQGNQSTVFQSVASRITKAKRRSNVVVGMDVYVNVYACKDLAPVDFPWFGKPSSRPYCVISIESQDGVVTHIGKNSVKEKTTHPVWDSMEDCRASYKYLNPVDPRTDAGTLKIVVLHDAKNDSKKDSTLGCYEVSLNSLFETDSLHGGYKGSHAPRQWHALTGTLDSGKPVTGSIDCVVGVSNIDHEEH